VRIQVAMIVGCAALLGASVVSPLYPRDQWLQVAPVIVALPGLMLAAHRGWLSTRSMACLCSFLALHLVGARWVYSFVPYDQWCWHLFGSGPTQWFNWDRNHYDRFVHLAFGALLTIPVVEIARRHAGMSRGLSLAAGVGFVLSASAVYEVFEWALAMIAAPQFADRYNGQQGDMWDAQKDMALALSGSLLATLGIFVCRRSATKTRDQFSEGAPPTAPT